MNEEFYKQTTLPNLSNEETPSMPRQIGPYKIEGLLNKGGMSFLYLGYLPEASQPVVIKVLSSKYLKNQAVVSRFLKEAEIISLTDHPNIVKLKDQGKWEKGLFIAMEFIQGVSLRQFLDNTPLSLSRALEIILQVAYALFHLHSHGVIHRDLKPENILITENGGVKVIDFGIAALEPEEQINESPSTPMTIGTPNYMSPEQIRNPNQLSYPSDIYSLGVIAYELLLGRLSHGVIQLNLIAEPLRTILAKALEKNPEKRYQDIADFISALSSVKNTATKSPSDVLIGMIETAQHTLLDTPPSWPDIEIGFAKQIGVALHTPSVHFVSFTDNTFAIALAFPLHQVTVPSLFYSATLQGALRTVLDPFYTGEKGAQWWRERVELLNRLLISDFPPFHLSLLFLHPKKNLLSFLSCGSNNLWHLLEESHEVRILKTPNAPLGSDLSSDLLEITDQWNPNDLLTLCSIETSSTQEEIISQQIVENRFSSAQTQAEQLCEIITQNSSSSAIPFFSLCLRRL